jgi:hypothetical protein
MTDVEVFDDDGYPTDAFLDAIKEWPHQKGYEALLDFALTGHTYPTFWEKCEPDEKGETTYHISTGGWSGNESIIDALCSNNLFWLVCWQQARRGGHYIFKVPKFTGRPASAPAEDR